MAAPWLESPALQEGIGVERPVTTISIWWLVGLVATVQLALVAACLSLPDCPWDLNTLSLLAPLPCMLLIFYLMVIRPLEELTCKASQLLELDPAENSTRTVDGHGPASTRDQPMGCRLLCKEASPDGVASSLTAMCLWMEEGATNSSPTVATKSPQRPGEGPSRALSVMMRLVEMHGGSVERSGNGFHAFWCATQDCVAQACSAAIAQQKALEMLNAKATEQGLPQLIMHIGLHTMPASGAGAGSGSESLAQRQGSEASQVAGWLALLCSHHECGAVCSEQTLSLVPGRFQAKCLTTAWIEGRCQPVVAYVLSGVATSTPESTNHSAMGVGLGRHRLGA